MAYIMYLLIEAPLLNLVNIFASRNGGTCCCLTAGSNAYFRDNIVAVAKATEACSSKKRESDSDLVVPEVRINQ